MESSSLDPKNCTVLYKILTPSERLSLPDYNWEGTALDRKDGFIHMSNSHQVAGTLQRFFTPQSGAGDELYLCTVPRNNIKENQLKFEPAADTLFGHIYGRINPLEDFTEQRKVTRTGPNGTFELGSLAF